VELLRPPQPVAILLQRFAVNTDPIVVRTPLGVWGTGAALPGAPLTTMDLIRRTTGYLPTGTPALALRIARRLGITRRHMVRSFDAPQEAPRATDTAPKLAARAVCAALADARCGVDALRLLIGHTATPHTLLPGNSAWVADELAYIGAHVELRQACTGFAAATVLCAGLVSSGAQPIGIVGSETGSVFLDPRRVAVDRTQLVNLLQMGDGAGAIVLGPLESRSSARLEMAFYGSCADHHAPGISLIEGGSGAPLVNATRVPHFTHDVESVRTHGLELLRAGLRAAAQAGIAVGSVDWWIPHPANGHMAQYTAASLGLPADKVVCEAGVLGNLGSAAIWVTLDRLRRSGRLAPGDRVMVLGAEASKYMYGGFLYVHGTTAA
jgi:3-oxoacyl-[acyl-carrier-protein] synthase-3